MGTKLDELGARLEEVARKIEECWERLLVEDEDEEEE